MDTGGKQVCVAANGATVDGSTSGFKCNDDSSLGMNDAISGAFQTPVDSPKTLRSPASWRIEDLRTALR
jgi:hypothetical protein